MSDIREMVLGSSTGDAVSVESEDKTRRMAMSPKKRDRPGPFPAVATKYRMAPRELIALTGTIPSIDATTELVGKAEIERLKARGPVGRWNWTHFENSARNDGLKLNHWVKKKLRSEKELADLEEDKVYAPSLFQKKLEFLEFEDYMHDENFSEDVSWSREASRKLYELSRRFDLRWPVVHDQFVCWEEKQNKSSGRSVNELKFRLFSMVRSSILRKEPDLGSDRPTSGLSPESDLHDTEGVEPSVSRIVKKYSFDLKAENARKERFDTWFRRTLEESVDDTAVLARSAKLASQLDELLSIVPPPKNPVLKESKKKEKGRMVGQILESSLSEKYGVRTARAISEYNGTNLRFSSKVEEVLRDLGVSVTPPSSQMALSVWNELCAKIAICLQLRTQIYPLEHHIAVLSELKEMNKAVEPVPEAPGTPKTSTSTQVGSLSEESSEQMQVSEVSNGSVSASVPVLEVPVGEEKRSVPGASDKREAAPETGNVMDTEVPAQSGSGSHVPVGDGSPGQVRSKDHSPKTSPAHGKTKSDQALRRRRRPSKRLRDSLDEFERSGETRRSKRLHRGGSEF